MSFLGIYKALYSYTPQSDQELAINEDDILYLIERSDVDDWWTVKKRVVGADAEEPVGLVPSNYIEEADVIGSAVALYDYEKQTDEELTFNEADQFQVYDDKDPDWILVSKNQQEYGFVPSNYIELRKGAAAAAASNAPAAPTAILPPPPTHPSLSTPQAQPQAPATSAAPVAASAPAPVESASLPPPQRYQQPESSRYDDDEPPLPKLPHQYSDDEEEAPPPKPARPGQSNSSTRHNSYHDSEPSRRQSNANNNDNDEGELYTWQVSEVDGRKKKKAMLAIGDSTIYFSTDSIHGGTPKQWKIKDLISYSDEKKHVFLEFKNPLYSLEIHAGTKEYAAQIINILSELKGANSSTALREVKAAATSAKPNKKQGKILYDFEAQGDDELTVREGDLVYIRNDKKSKDWWMVESVKTGRSGVVPAQFVDPVKDSSSSSFASKFKLNRSKSKENIKASPTKASPEPESPTKKLTGPKPSRVRTWEDRSGTFKVDAEFLGVVEGKIHLHKTNGVKIAVAAPKLSLPDLEYVERVTGMSLESYKGSSKSKSSDKDEKERRERRERERKRREREEKIRAQEERERQRDREEREQLRREVEETKRLAAEAKSLATDIPPQQPARPASTTSQTSVNKARSQTATPSKPSYDWFEFFLEAGVDVNQCQRYTTNFENEQIDPSIIESIDAAILRTLGLREGDIIRVTRYLDEKFGRQPKEQPASSNGGLFSEPSGALKVNRTGSASQVGNDLPLPTSAPATASKSDDDAWTVKPAFDNESKAQENSQLQTQQFTGSMQDLVNLKPLQPTASGKSTPISTKPLEPVKTGASVAPQKTGEITAQPTGVPLDPFKTGGGNILPLSTGGAFVYLPIQQTGAIGLQPTGLVPLQKTGGLNPAFTGGLIPLQKTGGITPAFTGGLVPLQKTGGLVPGLTGGLPQFGTSAPGSVPVTSFGLPPALTGGINPALTGGLNPTFNPALTGGLNPALTGQRTGFTAPPLNTFQPTGQLPQTSFGAQPNPFSQPFGTQPTGGLPQTSFGGQPTGGFPQTSFGAAPVAPATTGGFPQTSFGGQPTGFGQLPQQPNLFNQPQPQQQQFSLSSPPTFNAQQPPFNQQINQLTNSFQNTSLQSQQPFNTGFQPQQQPQPSFASFQQQPQQQQQPQPSFGGFGGFGQQQQQPLEAQPTGFGFGNSSGQPQSFGQPQQQFGQRANLANASADNPFGF